MGMGRAAERIETLNARPSLAAALAARQQNYSAKVRRGRLPAVSPSCRSCSAERNPSQF